MNRKHLGIDKSLVAPSERSLCVEHFPDKSPSQMEANRIAFACGRQHSLDDHLDNWPLYANAPELLEACKYMHTLLFDMGHGGLAGAILGENAIRKAEGSK